MKLTDESSILKHNQMRYDSGKRLFGGQYDFGADFDAISQLISEIRDHVNTYRHKVDLLSDLQRWRRICASMDLIPRLSIAVWDYFKNDFPESIGLQHIYLYGLLGALYVQQDALRALVFGLKGQRCEFPVSIKDIRKIRNEFSGHPVLQTDGGKNHSTYTSFLYKDRLEYLNVSNANRGKYSDEEYRKIDLVKISKEQLGYLIEVLTELREWCRERNERHLAMFQEYRLIDMIPRDFRERFSAIRNPRFIEEKEDNRDILSELDYLENVFCCMKSEGEKRRESTEWLEGTGKQYIDALKEIRDYQEGKMNHIDGVRLCSNLEGFDDLIYGFADLIDWEYTMRG